MIKHFSFISPTFFCYNNNIFGVGCHHNNLSSYCSDNIFGAYCSDNYLGTGNISNVFGDECYDNFLNQNIITIGMAEEFFNGGGHLNASGGEYYGPLEEAVSLFNQALVKYEKLLLERK